MSSSVTTARRAAFISSLSLRLFVYIFLRWILYTQAWLWTGAFVIYLVSWIKMDRTLVDFEASPQRTMDAHAANGHRAADPGKLTYAGAVKAESQVATVEPPAEVDPRSYDLPDRPSWSTYFTGALTSSRVTNRLSLLINSLLFLMAVDNFLSLTYSPLYTVNNLHYARVGAVGDTWARVSARVVDPSGARIIYRPTRPLGSWQHGPLLAATNATDYMAVAQLAHLDPSSQYEFRLTRPDQPTTIDNARFPRSLRFKTFPDPRLATSSHFTFAASSCLKPGYPYVPLKNKLAIDGAGYLADVVQEKAVDFVLFLGDFLYSDRPYFPGAKLPAYWRQYRQNFASPDWRRVYEQTPTLHIYDDHDFTNDFSGLGNDSQPAFVEAASAYHHYVGAANYPGVHPGVNYYSFRHGDTGFFVFDTRRYRSLNTAVDDETKTMLGSRQKADFLQWLHNVNDTLTFKFVVSSVPMMRLWEGPDRFILPDTWTSFQHERRELLDVMQYVPNVVVISGDKHEFAAATLRESVLEFSTSPLSMFYVPLHSLSNQTADGEDVALAYESKGASKFSTFEVDTRIANEPKVRVQVYIDGAKAWNVTVMGRPVKKRTGGTVGGLLPSLLEMLGFKRRRWA